MNMPFEAGSLPKLEMMSTDELEKTLAFSSVFTTPIVQTVSG